MRPTCKWCGRDLGVLPGAVFVCPHCDYDGDAGPDENTVKDVDPRP